MCIANEKLNKVFGKSKNGKLRVIKVSIENGKCKIQQNVKAITIIIIIIIIFFFSCAEELTSSGTAEVKKDWEKDYDKLIQPLIEENVPCFILYRLDSKTSLGFAWLLISFIPDTATIRQKMVYASTKATLKQEFGSAHITEELHATTIEETTLEGYYKHKKAFSAPAPLTTREEELAELRKTEVNTEINTDTRHQTLGGINCPMSEATMQAIRDLLRGSYDYLQFRIDLTEERIHVSHAGVVKLEDLPKQVPEDHARYHLYLFRHTHEGDYQESFVFIYSMPGYTCSVRERMMYSSCKAPFLESLQAMGVEVAKKVSYLNDTFYAMLYYSFI